MSIPNDRGYIVEITKYFSMHPLDILPSAETIEEFRKLKTDHQRVNFAYKLFSSSPIVHDTLFPRRIEKNNNESLKLRQAGNEMFRIKRALQQALLLYTESVSYAENGSSHLGLAYGNRSAVLFEKGYHKECLEDIDRALQNNYPDDLKEKLLNRRERATILQADNSKTFCYYEPAPQIVNKHPRISAATDSIELKRNEFFGTHIVTTRDVKAGEIISVEKPYAVDVVAVSKQLHCHECLELCFNMIPCDKCSTALYCSSDCRSTAFKAHHRYECDFGALIEGKLMSIKMTLLGAKEYKCLEKTGEDKTYRSDRYKEIYNLETNENIVDTTYLFICSTIAGIIFQCLKVRTNFLEENDLDEDMVKGLLLHNILVESTNSIGIEKVKFIPSYIGVDPVTVGRAVYAFSSRYNHSCAPNCFRVPHGTSFVIKAVRDIKQGEQCTISYGWVYITDSLAKRQNLLKSYFFFSCECVACKNSWPSYPNLDKHEDIMEAVNNLMTHGDGNNYCTLPAMQLCHILHRLSRGDDCIGKEDRDVMLAKCFHLQTLLVEPCKALAYIRNLISHLYHISGNKCVTF